MKSLRSNTAIFFNRIVFTKSHKTKVKAISKTIYFRTRKKGASLPSYKKIIRITVTSL